MKRIHTVTLNPAIDVHCEMDTFLPEYENRVQRILYHAGGKGINTSRALIANGRESTAYMILGRKNAAEFLGMLEADGIPCVAVYTEGRIRENLTLHTKGQRETRISSDLFSASADCLRELESRMTEAVERGDLLALSGSTPRGIAPRDILPFLKRQMEKGVYVAVDSKAFTGEDLRALCPHLIKPNDEECAALLGITEVTAESAPALARRIVQEGMAQGVLLSLGALGAVYSNGTRTFWAVPSSVEAPISTVGAGDSALAGWLLSLSEGRGEEESLRCAVAFGTAACFTEGTRPPHAEDIAFIASRIRIVDVSGS